MSITTIAPALRTIDLGTRPNRDAQGRFQAIYTLEYEIRMPSGEWVRMVRGLDAAGVQSVGHNLWFLTEDVVTNVAVTDSRGVDCTFEFECFCREELTGQCGERRRELSYRLLSMVPSSAV